MGDFTDGDRLAIATDWLTEHGFNLPVLGGGYIGIRATQVECTDVENCRW